MKNSIDSRNQDTVLPVYEKDIWCFMFCFLTLLSLMILWLKFVHWSNVFIKCLISDVGHWGASKPSYSYATLCRIRPSHSGEKANSNCDFTKLCLFMRTLSHLDQEMQTGVWATNSIEFLAKMRLKRCSLKKSKKPTSKNTKKSAKDLCSWWQDALVRVKPIVLWEKVKTMG